MCREQGQHSRSNGSTTEDIGASGCTRSARTIDQRPRRRGHAVPVQDGFRRRDVGIVFTNLPATHVKLAVRDSSQRLIGGFAFTLGSSNVGVVDYGNFVIVKQFSVAGDG